MVNGVPTFFTIESRTYKAGSFRIGAVYILVSRPYTAKSQLTTYLSNVIL